MQYAPFAQHAVRHTAGGIAELVDIGANLMKLSHGALTGQMQRAAAAGVTTVLLTGTSMKTTAAAQRLAERGDVGGVRLYYTAGIHPHDAKTFRGESDVALLRRHLSDPRCVAVGETGLDYDRMFSTKEQQIASFTQHVQLAVETQTPLFLHERDRDPSRGAQIGSRDDLLAVLDSTEHLPAVCIHCYTGDEATLRAYVKRGYYIGLTGFICKNKRGSALRRLLAKGAVPVTHLMVETDAPYMRPDTVPDALNIGQRTNEPSTLPCVVRTLSECLNVPEADLAQQLTNNTKKFFKLTE